jgi:hypothetical protein
LRSGARTEDYEAAGVEPRVGKNPSIAGLF